MNHDIDASRTTSELESELEALRCEIERLREAMHELRAVTSTPAPPPIGTDSPPEDATGSIEERTVSRRRALRTAGVIATGAVVGGITHIATAGPAAAAPGTFSGDPVALQGDAQTGTGVVATSVSGGALSATTSSFVSPAIEAANPNHHGMSASGTIGVVGAAVAAGTTGVRGDATQTVSGSGGAFAGPTGVTIEGSAITMQMQRTSAPAPSSGSMSYDQGALVVDNAGALWYCVTSGTPGTWRQLSSANSAGTYHPVTPGRVYDSRCAQPAPGPISSGNVRLLSVAAQRNIETGSVTNANFVPANATAVFANVSVINTVNAGFLTINPGGVTSVNASTINWGTSDQTQSNGVSLTLDNARQVTVVAGGPGATDFLIDIFGYWL